MHRPLSRSVPCARIAGRLPHGVRVRPGEAGALAGSLAGALAGSLWRVRPAEDEPAEDPADEPPALDPAAGEPPADDSRPDVELGLTPGSLGLDTRVRP